MGQTIGERIAMIRQTPPLGTVREPMSLRDFSAMVQRRTGMKLDKDKLSRIERGVQPLSVDDASVIASVDPMKRGRAWLAWGDTALPKPNAIETTHARPDDEITVPRTPQSTRKRRRG